MGHCKGMSNAEPAHDAQTSPKEPDGRTDDSVGCELALGQFLSDVLLIKFT